MKRLVTNAIRPLAILATLGTLATSAALASDAATSATASSNRYDRNGTASATAAYQGDVGFARTDSRSGPVSTARGVAVGFDEDGLSLSVSNAVATRQGLAVATNFNLEIERDGDVSFSSGNAVSQGPIHRSATAGGSAGNAGGRGYATSTAAGSSDRFGESRAVTRSHSSRVEPQRITRVARVHRTR